MDERNGSQSEGSTVPCLVLGPCEPPVGGVSRYCRALVGLLERSGWSAAQLDLMKTSSRELGIARSPVRRIAKRFVGGPSYALRSTLARHRPRLVVDNHQFLWSDTGYAGMLRRIVPSPYVLVVHDGRFPERVREDVAGGIPLADRLGWIAGAICMSDAIRDALVERVPGIRSVRLSPLIETPTGDGTERSDSWPSSLRSFFRHHETVLATSGALVEHYGLRDVLEAFGTLRSQGREIGLVLLLGSFAREEEPARLLREAIERWGDDAVLALTDFPDGSDVIARSDAYVRPSRVDGFGLGIREALLAGVPVVAAKLENRPDGTLLYEPGDGPGLVAALEQALSPAGRAQAAEVAPKIRAMAERNRSETLEFLGSLVERE